MSCGALCGDVGVVELAQACSCHASPDHPQDAGG